jgi:hypothetical protein
LKGPTHDQTTPDDFEKNQSVIERHETKVLEAIEDSPGKRRQLEP